MVWPTLGSRTVKEQNRTEQPAVPAFSSQVQGYQYVTLSGGEKVTRQCDMS